MTGRHWHYQQFPLKVLNIMLNIFKKKVVDQKPSDFIISEGFMSMWHYHISYSDKPTRGLCGKQTMHTSILVKDWQVPFGEHFPKKPTWCNECNKLWTSINENL